MSKIAWTFALVLGVALVLSASPADAQKRKKQQSARSSQVYLPTPSFRGAYNYAPRGGGGINFNDGRMGANYNPNQGG